MEDSTLYFTHGQSVGHQPCANLGFAQSCITKLSHLDLNYQISFLAHYATHNTQEVYLFIGKTFFKEYFLFMWIGGKYWPRCQYVLKANAIFVMSCFNFTSVCMKAKVYLFCKNEEGLLIEKKDTSVLQFTVHMLPVTHLILSRLYKLSNSFPTYRLIHVE